MKMFITVLVGCLITVASVAIIFISFWFIGLIPGLIAASFVIAMMVAFINSKVEYDDFCFWKYDKLEKNDDGDYGKW